jgi:hypothetical protein
VKFIAGGVNLMLKRDGTLWAQGQNYDGQLGIGVTPTYIGLVAPCTGTGNNSPATPRCGSTGPAACEYAQPTADTYGAEWAACLSTNSAIWQQVQGPNGTSDFTGKVQDITESSDDNSATILRIDGTVWTMGSNLYGQLGVGSVNNFTGSQTCTNVWYVSDPVDIGSTIHCSTKAIQVCASGQTEPCASYLTNVQAIVENAHAVYALTNP